MDEVARLDCFVLGGLSKPGNEVVANVYDENGCSVIQCNIRDITVRKQREVHNKLLLAEVNHRARNLLAVVQVIAQQTANHAGKAIFDRTWCARRGHSMGPSSSTHDMKKTGFSVHTCQEISTRPSLFDNEPYLPALVANSCSAMPMPWAAAEFRRTGGPSNLTRVSNRSSKCASCDLTSSATATPRHWFSTSRS